MTAKLPVFLFLLYPITKIMKEYLREKKRKIIRFFILLDLNIFSEVIEILQKSLNHTQFKN